MIPKIYGSLNAQPQSVLHTQNMFHEIAQIVSQYTKIPTMRRLENCTVNVNGGVWTTRKLVNEITTEGKLTDNARKSLQNTLEESIRLRTALAAILKNPCPATNTSSRF